MAMYLGANLGFNKLADGGYSPTFQISEYAGETTRVIPFTCQEVAHSEEEALRIAKAYAAKHVRENYPGDMKIRFREKA